MTMLEKVARAICSKSDEYCFWKDGLAEQDATCSGCLAQAKAAIDSMREPTGEMVKAGTVYWDPCDGSPIRAAFEPTKPYQAMIDTALKETA